MFKGWEVDDDLNLFNQRFKRRFCHFTRKDWAISADLLIPISLKPNGVNLWDFKLRIHSLKFVRFTTSGFKDRGIRKLYAGFDYNLKLSIQLIQTILQLIHRVNA